YSIQWEFKPRLNKVKASGGCHRFSEEIYRVELDKIWAQIRQGVFDLAVSLCRVGWNFILVRIWAAHLNYFLTCDDETIF
ncbi:hypothetical protein, partial [Siminovitchia terrae]|uniref:hypothetical protein n=1 Tax=Siminovitchia terrae TaxID=1914933 RepID=UPI0028AD1658